jgi:hypothetical protein
MYHAQGTKDSENKVELMPRAELFTERPQLGKSGYEAVQFIRIRRSEGGEQFTYHIDFPN